MSQITAPRFAVLQGEASCYRCRASVAVAAVAAPPEAQIEKDGEVIYAPNEHGWLGLSEIEYLPADVLAQLVAKAPGYRKDQSATAGFAYLLNHCGGCGAKQGDWFLHNEPDGPFFGEELMGLRAWIIEQPLRVDASFSEGPLGEWLEQTTRGPL